MYVCAFRCFSVLFAQPGKSSKMISNMTIEMERKRSCGSCLRYCMIVVNIIFAVSQHDLPI